MAPVHALGLRGASHLGAEGSHDDDFLFGKFLRDEQANLVAATHADQGEADAGVSGGGLDDGASALQLAFALGAFDQANGGTVFHAAARVQVFQFGEDVGRSRGGQLLHVQHRRFADQFGDIVADAQARVWLLSVTLQSKEREGAASMRGICNFAIW
jgi:hypothetical protein